MVQERKVNVSQSQSSRSDRVRVPPVAGFTARAGALIAGGGLIILLLFAARVALDVVIVLLFCGAIVILERTLGDWLADTIGQRGSTLVFAVAAAAAGWLLVGTDDGRARAAAFLSWAEERGFHGALIATPGAGVRVGIGGGSYAAPPLPEPRVIAPGRSPVGTDTPVAGGPTASALEATGRALAKEGEGEPAPATVTLRVVASSRNSLVLDASVATRGAPVSEGRVEFLVDGRIVATAPVRHGGHARTGALTVAPGPHRVTARFAGSDGLAGSTSHPVEIETK